MRNAFIRALTEAEAADERIVFLTGDLGFKLFDDFAARYPGRFMNVGVAEATMAGVAAGLAPRRQEALHLLDRAVRDAALLRADPERHLLPRGRRHGGGGGWRLQLRSERPTHHAPRGHRGHARAAQHDDRAPGDPAETVAAVHALARHRGPPTSGSDGRASRRCIPAR
jgi:transketolase